VETPIAVVKQHWRLHPPPNRSTLLGEEEENQVVNTDGQILVADSEDQESESIISNQEDEAIVNGSTDDDVTGIFENDWLLNYGNLIGLK